MLSWYHCLTCASALDCPLENEKRNIVTIHALKKEKKKEKEDISIHYPLGKVTGSLLL